MTDEKKTALGNTLQYIVNRMKEPSTWVGIAVFVGFFGLSEDTVSRITNNGPAIATAIGAVLAILLPGGKTVVTTDSAGDTTTTTVPIGTEVPSGSVADWADTKPGA